MALFPVGPNANKAEVGETAYFLALCINICQGNSVRLSVCPSHTCFVSKRLNVSSKFFHYLIGPSSQYIQCAAIKKTPLQNLQYLQNCVIFLYENFWDY